MHNKKQYLAKIVHICTTKSSISFSNQPKVTKYLEILCFVVHFRNKKWRYCVSPYAYHGNGQCNGSETFPTDGGCLKYTRSQAGDKTQYLEILCFVIQRQRSTFNPNNIPKFGKPKHWGNMALR